MRKMKDEQKKIQLLDTYISAFLALYVEPTYEDVNGKVCFSFPASDELYKLIQKYNANQQVSVLDYVASLRVLRAQIASRRGTRQEGKQ